jgi:hypothetical protein
VHFSGWLLDELRQRFPEDMARLAAMTARGQVEWFGSGDCEPVLAAIPARDRLSQIETLSSKLHRYFGQRPRGAWLTERVWESSVVPSLADSGIRYVAVDDYHFLCAGTPADALDSFYSTEEDDRRIDLFPISESLRYRLPFSPVAEAVAYLEGLARQGQRAAIYFDDIEKFGIWPDTHAWVYERGWLARFVEAVLASPLIQTATFADYHAANATRGVVYLPTTSYIEMNEWTLPAAAAHEYHALVDAERIAGNYERHKPYLRGGIWRNFLSRYAESNWMHKRMLGLSARLLALPVVQRTAQLQELLHRTQANDAYWHGLFGGLYLPHLRRAVWQNLIKLEAALDQLSPRAAEERLDLDLDGHDEAFLRSKALQIVVRDDGDACAIELASYTARHNFGDTLRRYTESYHDRIAADTAADSVANAAADSAATSMANSAAESSFDDGIASAHDRIAFKQTITAADVAPDCRPRGLFVDTLVNDDDLVIAIPVYRQVATAAGELLFVAECAGGRLEKRYRIEDRQLVVGYRSKGVSGHLQAQLNLAMPSCDGYGGRYILANGTIPCGFGETLAPGLVDSIILDDGELPGAVIIAVSVPARLAGRPHHTVSQSEAGFEKIMQAVELTLTWPLGGLLGGDVTEISVVLEFRPSA